MIRQGPRANHRATVWVVLAAGTCILAGCNDSAKTPVQVRPPAVTPAPTPSYASQPLPLPQQATTLRALSLEKRPAIDVLVDSVQAAYDAGQREIKAAHLDKAQADFDLAADMILKSGFPADFNPQLAKLSDEIGEAVQPGDLEASGAAGDQDEADTPGEPAPIEEIADMTLPAADPRLALKAQKELVSVPHDLPLTVNDSVLQYLSFFTTTRGRAIVARGLDRAGRYDVMIRRVLKEQGVPQDLIYLAQAESAFLPQAVSRAGARGIWQFMPYRGEEYDLERTYWVDDRSDPEKATRAAAHHLRDLYGMFGDWYLVMAAYNSGPLNVARAIERTGYADFWELQKRNALPKQTQNYVPIILAMALVAKDPAGYGVQVNPEKPAQIETVKLDHSISLQLVADASGAAKSFEENVQQVPQDKWTSWRLHPAEQGESLTDVARHYRVTVSAIETANHLEPHATVPSGFLLNVPTQPPVVRLVSYRVQRGDTLEGIAGRFDVTVDQLKRWNHISGGHVSRGARLRIYAGSQTVQIPPARGNSAENRRQGLENVSTRKSDGPESLEHRVKPGETLYSIAHDYQTSVSAIRQSNPFLAERPLQAGDVLTIQR